MPDAGFNHGKSMILPGLAQTTDLAIIVDIHMF